MTQTVNQFAAKIDHTLLNNTARQVEVVQFAMDAKSYNFFAVCVHPCHLKLVSETLMGSQVKICTVIDFPLGCGGAELKKVATTSAIQQGADEIDLVLNIGALKEKRYAVVFDEVLQVVALAREIPIKVIIETCLLTKSEKLKAAEICLDAGAQFVKTSTGFSTAGAQIEDIKLLRDFLKTSSLQIKASGGISSLAKAQSMLLAGASRLGTSSGVGILKEIMNKSSFSL